MSAEEEVVVVTKEPIPEVEEPPPEEAPQRVVPPKPKRKPPPRQTGPRTEAQRSAMELGRLRRLYKMYRQYEATYRQMALETQEKIDALDVQMISQRGPRPPPYRPDVVVEDDQWSEPSTHRPSRQPPPVTRQPPIQYAAPNPLNFV